MSDANERDVGGDGANRPDPAPVADPAALFDLTGRTAVVTGASSGLGERFARVLATAGATVVIAARRVERLEALAAELPGAVAVPTDVAEVGDRRALIERALEIGDGRLDVVVNNAGTGFIGPAEDEPVERFGEVVEVNLNAVFHLCQLASAPMLTAGAGSIVNIASMLGLVGAAPVKQASYCASKGAVINLTRELACQWARRGVRVNALAPGWFPSEMTEDMWGDERSEAFVARNCPVGRPGGAGELDGALLYLASDASTYTTGHTLVVDGGWTAR